MSCQNGNNNECNRRQQRQGPSGRQAHRTGEVVQQQDGIWVHHCFNRQRGSQGGQRRVCAPFGDQGVAGAVSLFGAG